MARLFIAVWPPEELAAQLTALHRKDQRGVRFVAPENWHITLRFLGNVHPAEVMEALDDATLPPARALVGPAVDVLAERALVVPVGGLDELAQTVAERTRDIGERPRKRFSGHLTVARIKGHVPMPRALGALIGAQFDVGEIALVHSRLDPHGARYETLHTWPLRRTGAPTVGSKSPPPDGSDETYPGQTCPGETCPGETCPGER